MCTPEGRSGSADIHGEGDAQAGRSPGEKTLASKVTNSRAETPAVKCLRIFTARQRRNTRITPFLPSQ